MSRLLLPHAALWPMLALRPEPFHSAADPESIERCFSELYGADSERFQMSYQSIQPPKTNVHAYLKSKCLPGPASGLHSLSRRR